MRVGVARPPSFTICTIPSKVVEYTPAERSDTLLLFLLYPYMYSVVPPPTPPSIMSVRWLLTVLETFWVDWDSQWPLHSSSQHTSILTQCVSTVYRITRYGKSHSVLGIPEWDGVGEGGLIGRKKNNLLYKSIHLGCNGGEPLAELRQLLLPLALVAVGQLHRLLPLLVLRILLMQR